MKATMKGEPEVYARAVEQLEQGALHFCPSGTSAAARSHGDEHHERFREGGDDVGVKLGKEHVVFGVAVSFRSAPPRPLPCRRRIGNKEVSFLHLHLPAAGFNQARLTIEELCRKIGLRVG